MSDYLLGSGNRKIKGPFGGRRKVAKEPRGVNHANQRFENEGVSACEKGLSGPCAKDVAKDWDRLWPIGGGEGQGGLAAQGVNRMESGQGWDQAVCKRSHG